MVQFNLTDTQSGCMVGFLFFSFFFLLFRVVNRIQANLCTWIHWTCNSYIFMHRHSADMYNQRAMDRAISDMSLKYYLYTVTNTTLRNDHNTVRHDRLIRTCTTANTTHVIVCAVQYVCSKFYFKRVSQRWLVFA